MSSTISPEMWEAYWEIQQGMSVQSAAKKHGVPPMSLWRRTKSLIPRPVGRPSIFSEYDENLLATLVRGFELFNLPIRELKFRQHCRELAMKRGEINLTDFQN